MSETRVQVVERAIDVLMVLTEGPATLTEVTRATGLPKGTAFRILGSLGYQNVVIKDPINNAYQLGPGFLQLGDAQASGFSALTTLARPALQKLWEQTQETIALHVRMGAERVCIEELSSPQSIRYGAELGVPVPLYVGSAGRILLAAMEPRARERVIDSFAMSPLTETTIVDRKHLLSQVETTAEQGYTESLGERVGAARAVSVPVRINDSFVIALSVLGPADRLGPERRMEILPDVIAAAAAIEAATGGGPVDTVEKRLMKARGPRGR